MRERVCVCEIASTGMYICGKDKTGAESNHHTHDTKREYREKKKHTYTRTHTHAGRQRLGTQTTRLKRTLEESRGDCLSAT